MKRDQVINAERRVSEVIMLVTQITCPGDEPIKTELHIKINCPTETDLNLILTLIIINF